MTLHLSTQFYQLVIIFLITLLKISLHLTKANTIILLTNHSTYTVNLATGQKVDLTWAWDETQGKKVIHIIKDGILMHAFEGATACQRQLQFWHSKFYFAMLITLFKFVRIFLLLFLKLLGKLPPPQKSEANSMMRFQSVCQMNKKGQSPYLCTELCPTS